MQPKFQCAVPFTPVTGPRILIRDAAEKDMLLKAAAQTLVKLTGTDVWPLVKTKRQHVPLPSLLIHIDCMMKALSSTLEWSSLGCNVP